MILGVSCDPPAANKAFREKFDFPYRLLSDIDRSVSVAYGAAASTETRNASRVSYLIAPDGSVHKVYAKVSPADHPDEVLGDLG